MVLSQPQYFHSPVQKHHQALTVRIYECPPSRLWHGKGKNMQLGNAHKTFLKTKVFFKENLYQWLGQDHEQGSLQFFFTFLLGHNKEIIKNSLPIIYYHTNLPPVQGGRRQTQVLHTQDFSGEYLEKPGETVHEKTLKHPAYIKQQTLNTTRFLI